MLEAFQSLREELAVKKPAEVDPSPHASKAGPSSNSAAHLDLPPPRSSTNAQSEAMDVDVGPALPPRLVLNQTSSDQYVAPSEAIPKDSSYSHKKQSHRQTVAPSSASDQLDEDSDKPRIHPRPKKHSDKSKHKSRSRYVSSSEEDHSPVARHRSSKPSRGQPSGAASDQDLPQHDPDPPYYREVALSDIPSQYSEEVDTFRRILSLTPGTLCLGLQLQCWVWMTKKAVKSSDLEVLPLSYHLAQLSRTPLINFNTISKLPIYLRENMSSLLHPLLSGIRLDSPLFKTKSRS